MNSVKIDKSKATRITRTLHLRIGLSFIGQTKSIDAYADAAATDSAGTFAPLIRSQSMIASCPNKTDRGRNQNERHHERSPRFVHVTEQAIERDAETDEDYLADEIAEDRQSKHRFMRENIVCRRGGVAAHDQFARNVKQTERRGEYHREVNRASGARGPFEWVHGFLVVGCRGGN